MGLGDFLSEVVTSYSEFHSTLPPLFQDFVILFVLVLLIVVYAVFVWKLRNFIGTKNIFNFDLNKYNTSSNPATEKITASMFFLVEYIFVIPFLVFFWFVIFTFFLMLIVEESISISTILIVSAIVVAAIRMSSYIPNYGEKISKDIAKIIPFTFLGIALLNPSVFTGLLERIGMRLGNISTFLSGIVNYLLFIISLEVILRFFEFMFNIAGITDTEPETNQDKEET